MWKIDINALRRRSFAVPVLFLLIACLGTGRALDKQTPNIVAILDEWTTLNPTTVSKFASLRSESRMEVTANRRGDDFTNVLFGLPHVDDCRACETFSFERTKSGDQMITVVLLRRLTSPDEALAVAEAWWMRTTGAPLHADPAAMRADEAPMLDRSAHVVHHGAYVAALLVNRERDGFAVRLSLTLDHSPY